MGSTAFFITRIAFLCIIFDALFFRTKLLIQGLDNDCHDSRHFVVVTHTPFSFPTNDVSVVWLIGENLESATEDLKKWFSDRAENKESDSLLLSAGQDECRSLPDLRISNLDQLPSIFRLVYDFLQRNNNKYVGNESVQKGWLRRYRGK